MKIIINPYVLERNKQIQQSIDSLDQFLEQDTLRIIALQNIYVKALFKSQINNVTPYADEALRLSKKLDCKFGLCVYYIWKGRSLIVEKKYNVAFQYFTDFRTE